MSVEWIPNVWLDKPKCKHFSVLDCWNGNSTASSHIIWVIWIARYKQYNKKIINNFANKRLCVFCFYVFIHKMSTKMYNWPLRQSEWLIIQITEVYWHKHIDVMKSPNNGYKYLLLSTSNTTNVLSIMWRWAHIHDMLKLNRRCHLYNMAFPLAFKSEFFARFNYMYECKSKAKHLAFLRNKTICNRAGIFQLKLILN